MKDNELRELAAKAAGIKLCWGSKTGGIECPALLGVIPWTWWDPLTDDGDALRLAVKLGLWITINTEDEMTVDVIKATSGPHGERPVHHVERFKYPQYGDANMAARRAIVRCAAEIGSRT